jgi:transcriptional regulator with XRE-family HTH domain
MTLRERLQFTRTNYELSQDAVAHFVLGATGKPVTRNYINMIEHNTGNVAITDKKLIEILNIIYKIGEIKKKENLTNKELIQKQL